MGIALACFLAHIDNPVAWRCGATAHTQTGDGQMAKLTRKQQYAVDDIRRKLATATFANQSTFMSGGPCGRTPDGEAVYLTTEQRQAVNRAISEAFKNWAATWIHPQLDVIEGKES